MDTPDENFEMWARVDLFGHTQRVGKLSVTNTGVELLYRLDTPSGDDFVTNFFGKGAVYSIMPMTEETARMIAARMGPPQPISQYDLPQEWREAIRQYKQLPAAVPGDAPETGRDEFDDEDEDGDDDPDF